MLVDGTVSFASSHDKARMTDPQILAVKRVVQLNADEEFEKSTNRQALLEVKLRSGRVLTHHTKAVRGTSINPMNRAEVETKCFDLLRPILGEDRARRLIHTIWNIDDVRSVRDLRPLLTA
jgi:2-methylcitrate dehydratase PrpD